MKKKIFSTMMIAAMLLFPLFMSAQTDGPGNPGGEPGGGDVPIGGGAPIGNGIGILLALGAAYGGKKLYT
ncbi:MAG: hypothetical protein KKF98_16810, partial [Bacteroidetes bacterium]|nr:hypothetical protein [Bacteroidota bacterium]